VRRCGPDFHRNPLVFAGWIRTGICGVRPRPSSRPAIRPCERSQARRACRTKRGMRIVPIAGRPGALIVTGPRFRTKRGTRVIPIAGRPGPSKRGPGRRFQTNPSGRSPATTPHEDGCSQVRHEAIPLEVATCVRKYLLSKNLSHQWCNILAFFASRMASMPRLNNLSNGISHLAPITCVESIHCASYGASHEGWARSLPLSARANAWVLFGEGANPAGGRAGDRHGRRGWSGAAGPRGYQSEANAVPVPAQSEANAVPVPAQSEANASRSRRRAKPIRRRGPAQSEANSAPGAPRRAKPIPAGASPDDRNRGTDGRPGTMIWMVGVIFGNSG